MTTNLSRKVSYLINFLVVESQIKHLNTNIQSQFNDLRSLPYRLHSVFIHRGYVSSGHYWIYIYDFARKMWRNYNDGYVTEVKDTKEIFERDSETRPSTPYFLVYIKDGLKDVLVDSVCRNIEEPELDTHDAEMLDVTDFPRELPEHSNTLPMATDSNTRSVKIIGDWDSSSNW